MIESKSINVTIAIAVAFALIISIAFVIIGNTQEAEASINTEPEYATKVFGADIISIKIIADKDDWQEMLNNAISEQFIMAEVIVNGKKFENVGVRPKGNSSLTHVASSDSDRYSFRLQFDEYIKDQTCFGLDGFVVNNMLGDNSYMKEYVSYELMQEIGVDAPYFGYADIKVNGESWGLYLAVEIYSESYEQRVFGDTLGMLYNVKSMDVGGNKDGMPDGNIPMVPGRQNGRLQRPDDAFPHGHGTQQNTQDNAGSPFLPSDGNANSDFSQLSNTGRSMYPMQRDSETGNSNRSFGGKGGGGRGSSGGSLEYTDDSTESYSSIFDNVVGKGTESDFQRVVQALKALSEGNELESYLDIDQILRYLAAHTIVVNLDSYSSNMAQNYYIYEKDGRITILPWDYNLAWGGFHNGSASSVINFPIDTPLSGVEMSSRPLIEKLFTNTEYLESYHSYLQQLIDNYFTDGKFEGKIYTLDALISNYVEKDATAFCTYEEYKKAISTFITLGNLRAKSVQGQLDGTIPSTTAEQSKNAGQLILAGNLELSDLGSMMGGRGGNNSSFQDIMGGQDKNSFPGAMNNGMIDGMEGMEPWGRSKSTPNNIDTSVPAVQMLVSNNLILIGVLSLVLITALAFTARFRKSY